MDAKASPLGDSDTEDVPAFVDSDEERDSTPPKPPGSDNSPFKENLESFFSLAFAAREAFHKSSPQKHSPKKPQEDDNEPTSAATDHDSTYATTEQSYSIANKDEANRAYDEGLRLYESGSYSKAINMFKLSIRLYPTADAKHMLEKANQKLSSDAKQSSEKPGEGKTEKEREGEREKERSERNRTETQQQQQPQQGAGRDQREQPNSDNSSTNDANNKRDAPNAKAAESSTSILSWIASLFSKTTASVESTIAPEGVATYTKEQEEESKRRVPLF